ncbi:hypothetical protein OsI_15644 [Oryza sativa Indica Group]|uniref:Uncharacterized protein n=1 Tax=Oryza sativa subsp. indica TaxID=39946 RepID=B8AT69_ORYSI|nr:hypothetical protein OsI_15644 [Oryza sativa Indica Group]
MPPPRVLPPKPRRHAIAAVAATASSFAEMRRHCRELDAKSSRRAVAASLPIWPLGGQIRHRGGRIRIRRTWIHPAGRSATCHAACGQFVRINCRRPRPRRSPGPLPRRAPVRACREEVIGECVDAVLAVVALGCGKRGAVAGGGMAGEPPDAALDAARTAASPSCAGVEGPRGGVAFGFRF